MQGVHQVVKNTNKVALSSSLKFKTAFSFLIEIDPPSIKLSLKFISSL